MELQLPVQIRNQQGDIVGAIEQGAAEGEQFLTLTLFNGDIAARNFTGGTVDDPNLDIGAGSSADRGVIVTNYDVGRGLDIGSGRKRPIAIFRGFDDPKQDVERHYASSYFNRGIWVPDGSGGWRHIGGASS